MEVSKRSREISDLQFRAIVVSTLANVRKLYYDLIYAGENLGAQRKSLALAQKFLNENQIKVNVAGKAAKHPQTRADQDCGHGKSCVTWWLSW